MAGLRLRCAGGADQGPARAGAVRAHLGAGVPGLARSSPADCSACVDDRLQCSSWSPGPGSFTCMCRFGEAFVDGYVLDENIRLFATSRFGNQPGPWFYFQILATGLCRGPASCGRLVDDVVGVIRGSGPMRSKSCCGHGSRLSSASSRRRRSSWTTTFSPPRRP